jgi:hypothetical protein
VDPLAELLGQCITRAAYPNLPCVVEPQPDAALIEIGEKLIDRRLGAGIGPRVAARACRLFCLVSISISLRDLRSGSMIGIDCRDGSYFRCLDISLYLFSRASSSDHRITVVVTSIRSGPVLVTDRPRGSWGLPVWPVGGVSNTISSRFSWRVRRRLWNDSVTGIMTVRATITITRPLLGRTEFFLLRLQAGDAGGLA